MSVVSSHVMFIDSRASTTTRDSVQVNCITTAPQGCQIRVSMVEFDAPAGAFGDEHSVYLRMNGASLTARESEGLSLPPDQQVDESHLNPSSILAKIPITDSSKATQFQSPFLLYSSNSLSSHFLGHFTLEVGNAQGQSFSSLATPGSDGKTGWDIDPDGSSPYYFSTAIRVEIVQVSNGDGGGHMVEQLGAQQYDFLAGVQVPANRLRQYAA